METSRFKNPDRQQKYLRAKKRTEELRKFYKHVIIYVVVNIAISAFKLRLYMRDGESLEEVMTRLDMYIVWVIWGVFLLLQAIKTYRSNVILGSDWEEKKIREFMNEGKR